MLLSGFKPANDPRKGLGFDTPACRPNKTVVQLIEKFNRKPLSWLSLLRLQRIHDLRRQLAYVARA